jgi:hypothetical protein
MDELFRDIVSDRTPGASETYIKILNHIILGNLKDPDLPGALVASAGDMVPLHYLARRLSQEPVFRWKDTAGELQREIRQQVIEAGIQLYKQLEETGNILLCHSRSGSVLKALEHRKNRVDSVYQTVSRPGEEGRSAAETLKMSGFRVELIDDGEYLRPIGMGAVPVLGADAVTEEFIVNKVGSLAIVQAALDADISPIFLAGREKLIQAGVYGNRPESPIFERIPLNGVKVVVGPQMFALPKHSQRLETIIGSQDFL